MVSDGSQVSLPLTVEVSPSGNSDEPAGAWITKPVSESITDAMERAPMGAFYEIIYASLASRLKQVLDPEGPAQAILTDALVADAVNFRAINPSYFATTARVPATPGNFGAGAGNYHSKIWGPSPDERLPFTEPLPTPSATFAEGQTVVSEANKGLLIAKLFADLQNHLPCVLFNVTNKDYQSVGIGGSSAGRRFRKDGKTVTELVYKLMVSAEATVVTEDDNSTSHLQAIVEAAFGVLRDHVNTGSAITGRSWELMLPTHLSTSGITDVEAPWAAGDDKGGKLYTASVSLESMYFEAVTYVGRPIQLNVTNNFQQAGDGLPAGLSIPGETDLTVPMRLKLGRPQRLIVTGAPVTSDVTVEQSKRVLELRRPLQAVGVYEVVPRRTGNAILYLYDTNMTVDVLTHEAPAGRTKAPLAQRSVVVTAV